MKSRSDLYREAFADEEKRMKSIHEINGEYKKPYSLLFSNNALMVMFNIASELLTQKTSELRTTHMRILHKRCTVKDDRTIGQNMRSGVIYGDVEYLNRLLSIITPLIYAGDSLVISESE